MNIYIFFLSLSLSPHGIKHKGKENPPRCCWVCCVFVVFFFLFIILLLLQCPCFFIFLFSVDYVDSESTKLQESGWVQACPVPPNTYNGTPLPHNHDSYTTKSQDSLLYKVLAKKVIFRCVFSLFVLKTFSFSGEAKEKS